MIVVLALTSFGFTAPGGSLHRGLFGHDAAIRNLIGHDAAIDAFRLAAEALSLAANRLPNFYSSKQGMTPENPAVFGGGGTALLSFADSLQDADDISDCSDDLHFAAAQLEPLELGSRFDDAGEAFTDGWPLRGAAAIRYAAADIAAYGQLLRDEDDDPSGAGAMLEDAANHLRVAARELRFRHVSPKMQLGGKPPKPPSIPKPSIAECLEATFVPAVMSMARGDITELKLFIASAQAGYKTNEPIETLSSEMDALPVQTAGRPLAPEESALRSSWIALVYLTLDRLASEKGGDESEALVPDALRSEYESMVSQLVQAKKQSVPLSSLNLNELAGAKPADATAEALLKQAFRVVYLTLDNVESADLAGTRADAPKEPGPSYIPGTR